MLEWIEFHQPVDEAPLISHVHSEILTSSLRVTIRNLLWMERLRPSGRAEHRRRRRARECRARAAPAPAPSARHFRTPQVLHFHLCTTVSFLYFPYLKLKYRSQYNTNQIKGLFLKYSRVNETIALASARLLR